MNIFQTIGEILSTFAIIWIALLIIVILVIIRLICAIFEMNNNIRDIREILISNYEEAHPDYKFGKRIANKETNNDENKIL